MIFTVINYIPILEEETASHRVELTKKMKQNDSSGGGDSADKTDIGDDNESDTSYFLYLPTLTGEMFDNTFFLRNQIYAYLISNINTPPPKI